MITVEVLNRMGKVRERSQHNTYPISIGRDYAGNQIALDDDYVSPRHVSIEQDELGRAVITDLDSDNGMTVLPSRERVSRTVIESEGLLRIGHTVLRIRTPAFVLPPTKREGQYFTQITHSFNRAEVFIAIVAVTMGWLYFGTYWNDFSKPEWGALLMPPVWTLVAVGVWAGCWAMASRISQQTFSFRIHCCIACLAILVAALLEVVYGYYVFAFAAGWSGNLFLWGGAVAWLGALLWGHLRLCTLMSARRLALNAGLVAACVVGLISVSWYSASPELNALASYHAELKPPVFQIANSVSGDAFFDRVTALQREVDKSITDD